MEEKIRELEERIEFLEKQENKRITKKRIKIAYEISKIVLVIIVTLILYTKIIRPYKEKISYIEDKVNSVERIVNDTYTNIKKFIKF